MRRSQCSLVPGPDLGTKSLIDLHIPLNALEAELLKFQMQPEG